MFVEMRYYKRFDPDLIALFEAGVNLNEYVPEIIDAYANGKEYHLYVPFCKNHDMNGQQLIHKRVFISDNESIQLLKGIKHGYRNSFCKMLIREVLVYQNLSAFFADQKLIQRENVRTHKKDLSEYENLIIAQMTIAKYTSENETFASSIKKNEKKVKNNKIVPVVEENYNNDSENPSLQEENEVILEKLNENIVIKEKLSEIQNEKAIQEGSGTDEIPSLIVSNDL